MLALDARVDWMNRDKPGNAVPAAQRKGSVADRLKAFLRGKAGDK